MTLIPWLIAVYATICVVVYFGNRLFMYFPNPTRAAPAEAGLDHVKEIKILAADGVKLVAWYAPARDDKPTSLLQRQRGKRRQSLLANGDRWERAIARNISLDAPYR